MTSAKPDPKADQSVIDVPSEDSSVVFKVGDDDTSDVPVVVAAEEGEEEKKKTPAKRKRGQGKSRAKKQKTGTSLLWPRSLGVV